MCRSDKGEYRVFKTFCLQEVRWGGQGARMLRMKARRYNIYNVKGILEREWMKEEVMR